MEQPDGLYVSDFVSDLLQNFDKTALRRRLSCPMEPKEEVAGYDKVFLRISALALPKTDAG
jgi:hypothetical protein